MCIGLYKTVTLVNNHDNIHGMTYITKIVLGGIVMINTGYFDNTNDKLPLKIKLKGIVKIT